MDGSTAFERFCVDVHPRLVAALTHLTGDRWLAEELAQEALIRAGDRWTSVRQMASPAGWAFTTGANLGRTHFRRRGIERRALQRMARHSLQPEEADITDRVVIRDALQSLSVKQREVIVLRFYLRLTAEEAAVTLDATPGAVRALTHRAVAALRDVLDLQNQPEGVSDGP